MWLRGVDFFARRSATSLQASQVQDDHILQREKKKMDSYVLNEKKMWLNQPVQEAHLYKTVQESLQQHRKISTILLNLNSVHNTLI